ncbi:B12-binding domain-containing radical SAM protein [Chloroflexota bacterium]
MKVLFVFLNDRKRTLIPTNLSLLKSVVQNRGFETRVFDTSFYQEHERFTEEDKKEEAGIFKGIDYATIGVKIKKTSLVNDFLQDVANWQPDLVAFSVYSATYNLGKKLASALKEQNKDALTIFGGIHVSIEPENVIREPAIDFICIGEGEEALVELCENLSKKKSVENIRNIWSKRDKGISRNPLRPPINMDDLPIPNWDEFKSIHYYAPYRGKFLKTALVEFSRVCPFDCAYCGNGVLRKLYLESGIKVKPRHKSPRKFIDDLGYLKQNYGLEFVFIADGTFLSFPTSVLEELTELYVQEISLPFFITTTPSSINTKRAKLLKEMGCISVNMGIECGDSDYRRDFLFRASSDKSIIDGFRIVREAGMEARSYNIIGLPFETRKSIFKTIELNRKCNPHSASMAIFIPYQGTHLGELSIKEGLMDNNCEILGDGTVPNIRGFISDSELMGLFNTFSLYIKAPKILFPLIRFCEKDNWLSNKLRRLFMKVIYK